MSAPGPPPPEVIAALKADPLPWANQKGNLYAVTIALTVILWISLIGRLWTRVLIQKKPWWDDVFCTVAVIFFTQSTIAIDVMTRDGLGQHAALLPLANLKKVLHGQWVWGIAYAAGTATIKISLLLQYLRVYEQGTWTYRWAQLVLVLVALWGFALTFISTFVCFPSPSAFWNMTAAQHNCYGFAATNINELTGTIKAHSASNFFFDLCVFVLAVRLQFLADAQSNRKSMLAILFMGSLACGFAMWRLIDIAQTGGGVGADPTWNMPGPGMLSTAEVFIGCLCATIPFFWPAIRAQFNKIFVHYDFHVTEDRIADDDEYELTKTKSNDGRGVKVATRQQQHDQEKQQQYTDAAGTTSNVTSKKPEMRF